MDLLQHLTGVVTILEREKKPKIGPGPKSIMVSHHGKHLDFWENLYCYFSGT